MRKWKTLSNSPLKGEDTGLEVSPLRGDLEGSITLADKEISLIQHLQGFEAAVKQAGQDYNPSCIANYCYDLVKEYNQFCHDFSVLKEEDDKKRIFRIALSAAVGQVVKNGMGLLGIEVPERM